MKLFFSVLSLIPVLYYWNKPFVASLPFSQVIRDHGRFIIFSVLSYSVLISYTFEEFIIQNKKISTKRRLFYIGFFIIIIVLAGYPFWLNKISGKDFHSFDIRLRTLIFSEDYMETESFIKMETADVKSLYLPLGGMVGMLDHPEFRDIYHEINDLFASYSPVPGMISFADRRQGGGSGIITILKQSILDKKIKLLRRIGYIIGVKYFVVRTDMHADIAQKSMKCIADLMDKENSGIEKKMESARVLVYENDLFCPHVYAFPNNIGLSNDIDFLKSDECLKTDPFLIAGPFDGQRLNNVNVNKLVMVDCSANELAINSSVLKVFGKLETYEKEKIAEYVFKVDSDLKCGLYAKIDGNICMSRVSIRGKKNGFLKEENIDFEGCLSLQKLFELYLEKGEYVLAIEVPKGGTLTLLLNDEEVRGRAEQKISDIIAKKEIDITYLFEDRAGSFIIP